MYSFLFFPNYLIAVEVGERKDGAESQPTFWIRCVHCDLLSTLLTVGVTYCGLRSCTSVWVGPSSCAVLRGCSLGEWASQLRHSTVLTWLPDCQATQTLGKKILGPGGCSRSVCSGGPFRPPECWTWNNCNPPAGEQAVAGKSCDQKLLCQNKCSMWSTSWRWKALADTRLVEVCFSKERTQEIMFNSGLFLFLSIFFMCIR